MRALRLHLGHLLSLGRVQEVELLDLAVRGRSVLSNCCCGERAVRRGVLASCRPVLADGRQAIGRDRVGHLDHGELRQLRTARQSGPGDRSVVLLFIGTVAVFQAVIDAHGELVLSAMLMPAVSPNILATFTFFRACEGRLPLLLEGEMRDVVLDASCTG